MSYLYRLIKAIQGMLEDQEREFRQACAQDKVLIAREHIRHGSEYLGELPYIVSKKALALIIREHRKALKSIPSSSKPWPDNIRTCNDECNVSFELGVPCHHTIYVKLTAATPLTKWDIHPRWHLREPVSRDVYRRILDPRIATSLRGRPKNNPQQVPARMAVSVSSQTHNQQASDNRTASSQPKRRDRPTGSQNKTVLARVAREAAQTSNSPSNERLTIHLGGGNTTGIRASGRRTQPSVRRRRSQWELSVDEGMTPCVQRRSTTAIITGRI
ncbi:transposase, partial [Metarhizium majus ARSEF 297]